MSWVGDEERIAEAVQAGADGIVVPGELLAEPAPLIEKSLLLKIREMTVSERIKLALRGNREARMILVRDGNALIRRFVLQNPRITDEEVIALAKSRTTDDEMLRRVADSRDWTKNYQVRLGLVTNPKTPIVVAMRFMSSLHERDVRLLAKSKNVSSAITAQARRIVQRRMPRGGKRL